MRSEMCEAVTPADVGGLRCKWCGKPATPRRILGYARSTITAVPRRSVRVRAASQVSKVSVADT